VFILLAIIVRHYICVHLWEKIRDIIFYKSSFLWSLCASPSLRFNLRIFMLETQSSLFSSRRSRSCTLFILFCSCSALGCCGCLRGCSSGFWCCYQESSYFKRSFRIDIDPFPGLIYVYFKQRFKFFKKRTGDHF
jgi:hypothetical protein